MEKMEVDDSVVDLSISSRRSTPTPSPLPIPISAPIPPPALPPTLTPNDTARARRVLRPRTEPRSYAESPDTLINGLSKPRTNGTAEFSSSDDEEIEMPPLAPIKELSPQEVLQRERGLRRLREELRAEEMKLVLLKKLRQSQQLKENVAVVPPVVPPAALPPTGLPSGLSITPTTVKVPLTKGQQPQNAHMRHSNQKPPGVSNAVPSLLRGQPLPARSSLHAPTLSGVSITNRNSANLSVPQPPQRNSLSRPLSSFPAVAKELSPAVTITPAPPQPQPQNKGATVVGGVDGKSLGGPTVPLQSTPDQERPRDESQTPAQRQAAAKLALRKQLEKTLLQIPPPKPPPPEMHFIPNPSNTEFIYLVGLEHVVDFLTKDPKPQQSVMPHSCQQCKIDFTPVWKWEKQSKNRQSNATFHQPAVGKDVRVICEQCVTTNVKKALKAEHTNRLKTAFVKALQQEQEIEQRLAQNGVFQISCNSPAPSPAAPEQPPKTATPTPTPRHAATPPAPPPAQPTPPPARQSSHSQSNSEKFNPSASAAAMQALHQQLLRGLSAAGAPPAHMLPFTPLFYPYMAMAQAAGGGGGGGGKGGSAPNMADIQRAAELQRQYLLDMIPPQAGQTRHNWKT